MLCITFVYVLRSMLWQSHVFRNSNTKLAKESSRQLTMNLSIYDLKYGSIHLVKLPKRWYLMGKAMQGKKIKKISQYYIYTLYPATHTEKLLRVASRQKGDKTVSYGLFPSPFCLRLKSVHKTFFQPISIHLTYFWSMNPLIQPRN